MVYSVSGDGLAYSWTLLLRAITENISIRVTNGLAHVVQKTVNQVFAEKEQQEGVEQRNGVRSTRKPCFSAVTLSTSDRFQKEHGANSYQAMKGFFDRLLKAFYAVCRRFQIVCGLWYRFVVQDGHPHIHGVLAADTKQAQRELSRLWSKFGLGYREFRNRRKRGNVCFREIYDMGGWLKYCHCRNNKFGTGMKWRYSYHGRKLFKGLSPFDLEREWRKDKFSTLLNVSG